MALRDPTTGNVDSGIWTFTGVIFAASLIGFAGVFHVLVGVTAILGSGFYSVEEDYPYRIDTTLWGVLQILLGGLSVAAAISILSGKRWAILFGIAMAAISAVGAFLSIPYYPLWNILILTIDLLIIWVLATKAGEAAD
jgi:hypothetical protein